MSREPGLSAGRPFRRGSAAGSSRMAPGIARAPGERIRAGDYRASRQMALWTRRKSTWRRTTSSGSLTLMTPGSHVTDRTVQAASGMWTVRVVTSGGIRVATCPRRPLFPAPLRSPALFPGPGLALAEPAERRLGPEGPRIPGNPRLPGRRLVLAVAPGAARALLVVALPARDADHVSHCAAPALRCIPYTRVNPGHAPG
jgi:hypothetical protein